MNLKVCVLVCLVLVLVIMMDQTEGRRCRKKCRFSCKVKCSWRRGKIRCRPKCGLRCRFSCGKRDEAEPLALDDESDPSVTVSNNFSDYDENEDGKISLDEFKNVIPIDNSDGFSALDKDGDSLLNCEEFINSNLDFGDRQPSC